MISHTNLICLLFIVIRNTNENLTQLQTDIIHTKNEKCFELVTTDIWLNNSKRLSYIFKTAFPF